MFLSFQIVVHLSHLPLCLFVGWVTHHHFPAAIAFACCEPGPLTIGLNGSNTAADLLNLFCFFFRSKTN